MAELGEAGGCGGGNEVSREPAPNYVERAFAKTGSDRSAKLVALLPQGLCTGPLGERKAGAVTEPGLEVLSAVIATLGALTERARLALAALDALAAGMIVVTAEGRALFANRAAEAMAAETDGLSLGDRGRPVGAATVSESAALLALIASATGGLPDGGGASAGGAMPLSRPSGRRAYNALVTPLPRALDEMGDGAAAPGPVLLIVTDPEWRPEANPGRLARLYGLTPAEAGIAAALAGGDSLATYADAAGITMNTARFHLKQMFQKTDTHSQLELIRLFLGSGFGLST